MITGNALVYFNALARCCPPHPEPSPPCLPSCLRTLRYSIKHCRKRIKDGMLMISGTIYCPPQLRSGFPVDEWRDEKNMHADTNISPNTFAYDVKTSARSISANLPSFAAAMPPTLTRLRIERKRKRPVLETWLIGSKKDTTRKIK
jgi:hypothetical protein